MNTQMMSINFFEVSNFILNAFTIVNVQFKHKKSPKTMADIYIQQINAYQGDCPCIFGPFPMFSNYIENFAKGKTGHGLDVGAGPQGCNSKFFQQCSSLDGCDALRQVVDSFPQKYSKKFVYFLGKQQPLPYQDESKDFVVCSCVIQHLDSHEQLERGIKQMARVLKKGGSLYLMYKAGTHDSLLTHFNAYYKQQRTFRVFCPEKVNQLLIKYGMEIEKQIKSMDNNWIPYVNVIAVKI